MLTAISVPWRKACLLSAYINCVSLKKCIKWVFMGYPFTASFILAVWHERRGFEFHGGACSQTDQRWCKAKLVVTGMKRRGYVRTVSCMGRSCSSHLGYWYHQSHPILTKLYLETLQLATTIHQPPDKQILTYSHSHKSGEKHCFFCLK